MESMRRRQAFPSAGSVLPSNEQEFYLRLIELYREHGCLWNSNLPQFGDVALKRSAWEAIAKALSSRVPMTSIFLQNRINTMRQRLNLYKLQEIEFEMSPNSVKRPEKPYYMDNFAFLDQICNESHSDEKSTGDSISEGFSIDSAFKESTKSKMFSMVSPRLMRQRSESETGESRLTRIADLVKQRQQLNEARRLWLRSSQSRFSLRVARPGESVSNTFMTPGSKTVDPGAAKKKATAKQHSEDEELFSTHWIVRQKLRTRRPMRQRFGQLAYGPLYREPVPPPPQSWLKRNEKSSASDSGS